MSWNALSLDDGRPGLNWGGGPPPCFFFPPPLSVRVTISTSGSCLLSNRLKRLTDARWRSRYMRPNGTSFVVQIGAYHKKYPYQKNYCVAQRLYEHSRESAGAAVIEVQTTLIAAWNDHRQHARENSPELLKNFSPVKINDIPQSVFNCRI